MLRRKNGFLYLRKHIPRPCRPAMGGRKELLISLKTRDPELAKLRWRIVSARVDAMLAAAKRGTIVPLESSLVKLTKGLDEEQREAFEAYLLTKLPEADDQEDDGLPQLPRKPLALVERGRFKSYFTDTPLKGTADNPLLSVALQKREAESTPTAKTRFAWNIALQRFRSLACDGQDLPVRSVTRAHLVRFKDGLLKIPSKNGRGTLTPQSAVKDLNAIKGLLSYALQQGWIEANPGAGLSVAKGTNGKSDRLPYETDEARALLTAAAALPLDGPREGANRYLPMILAYSGMRMGEAGVCGART